MSDAIVIVGAARTPMGGMLGDFATVPAAALGSAAIKAALERSGVAAEHVAEVLMGCVLPAGQGQAPARQASRGAGIADAVGATTINKMCGSGLKAVMMAHDMLKGGNAMAYVAGGMESMSNAPYLLPKARSGYRMGHGQIIDHMFMDGLEDAYDKGRLMGAFAEECADQYGFTREAQDAFAIESLARANAAIAAGAFAKEITPVTVADRKGDVVVEIDEQPGKAKPEKIPTLKPAFRKDGTVTAANASSISDGAAALVLMRERDLDGQTPLARIVGHSSYAQKPGEFTVAPVGALTRLLEQVGWSADDVDLWEINEAFAVVTMAAMAELKLDHAKVNVHGGACALGHPIGASGARVLVTLLHALERHGKRKGIATLCIGGGEAVALAVERM
jgi:acetyl-CoA C-acetyltransferase